MLLNYNTGKEDIEKQEWETVCDTTICKYESQLIQLHDSKQIKGNKIDFKEQNQEEEEKQESDEEEDKQESDDEESSEKSEKIIVLRAYPSE